MRRLELVIALLICVGGTNVPTNARAQAPSASASSAQEQKTGVLASSDIDALVPSVAFFKGRTASLQLRNTGAVRFADGSIFFAALVDTSGYSSAVREKYQFYLVTESPLEIAGRKLGVGVYGGGFLENGTFVVMDVSGHDVLTGKTIRDEQIKRPRPLQVIAGSTPGELRLVLGRQYVTFKALPR